jgi:phosphoribosylglycinamide formyltransferase 2
MSFLVLGSGELGKEFVITAQRYGFTTVAVDKYPNAPAMQVADHHEVINMLDPDELEKIVDKYKPDYIVPEIESIRVEKLFDFEKRGICVVPSAYAVSVTMNRKKTRELAKSLGLETAKYRYANNLNELKENSKEIGFPCVIKPLMSSSGKGQTIVKTFDELELAWRNAISGSRGDIKSVIIEEYINFHSEITLLTVTQSNGSVKFCNPIGHLQKNGDYHESWQPHFKISLEQYQKAKDMASKITKELGGNGIWGVEFFLLNGGHEILFSELSPRPHDTGMVTLVTQYQNEFELHLRAILGWNVNTKLVCTGRSKALLSKIHSKNPKYSGLDEIFSHKNTDIRIFNKPLSYPGRRMGVLLVFDDKPTKLIKTINDSARHFRVLDENTENDDSSSESTDGGYANVMRKKNKIIKF